MMSAKKAMSQRGYILLPGVLIVLALALMLLGAQIPRTTFLQRLWVDERHALQTWQRAMSGLEQGERLEWRPSASWNCRPVPAPAEVCVRLSARAGLVLMRATGASVTFAPRITLYRYFFAAEPGVSAPLRRLPNGWLDYCPEPREALCRK